MKALRWVGAAVGAGLLLAAGMIYMTERERSLALATASDAVAAILSQPEEMAARDIPADRAESSYEVVDVDLYGREWLIWQRLAKGGSLVVRVHARRGVWLVPAFNTRDTLVVDDIDYVADAR